MYGIRFKCLNCNCSGCGLDWTEFITDEDESVRLECGSSDFVLEANN